MSKNYLCLKLNNNLLEVVPPSLIKLSANLKIVHLNFNNITKLDGFFNDSFFQLTELSLSNNQLTEISEKITFL